MSTCSCYHVLFLYLIVLNAKHTVIGKDTTGCELRTTKRVSQVKSALCKVNSKLSQTADELNELKTELNVTLLSLYDVKIQLERHIAQYRQDLSDIRKEHEKLLSNGNQQIQKTLLPLFATTDAADGPITTTAQPTTTTASTTAQPTTTTASTTAQPTTTTTTTTAQPTTTTTTTTAKPTTTTTTTTTKKIPTVERRPRDCSEVRALGRTVTGIYKVYPDTQKKRIEMSVYCDFSSQKESWLVFQRRKDGKENFDRSYNEYERGFGNLSEELWLGNEKLHLLTSGRKYKLRIELIDFQGTKRYAQYSTFSIDSATNSYRLTIGGYSGTAGDSLTYHNGMKFTTKDVDNDLLTDSNCASTLRGGWWYKTCHASNLNGLYLGGRHNSYGSGIIWNSWHGFFYSLQSTEIKITPK